MRWLLLLFLLFIIPLVSSYTAPDRNDADFSLNGAYTAPDRNVADFSLTEAVADPCAYGGSGDYVIDGTLCTNITTNVDVLNNNVVFNGTGTVLINANITNWSSVIKFDGVSIAIVTGQLIS